MIVEEVEVDLEIQGSTNSGSDGDNQKSRNAPAMGGTLVTNMSGEKSSQIKPPVAPTVRVWLLCRLTRALGRASAGNYGTSPPSVRIWAFEDSFRLPCPCIRFWYYITDPRSLSFSPHFISISDAFRSSFTI